MSNSHTLEFLPHRIKREYLLRNKPTLQQYIDGLSHIQPDEREKQVLCSQYSSRHMTVKASELAVLAGFKSHCTVNSIYGRFGHRLCDRLGIDPDDGSGSERNRWWSIWSDGFLTTGGFYWRMHKEVASALETLGWIQYRLASVPPKTVGSMNLYEGGIRQVTLNAYERNRDARAACISHYGCRCSVCDLSFADTYGNAVENFIHVHHIHPLSERKSRYHVDPVGDLRPVCPNCHAVIHMRKPAYSIEEVKQMIRRNR